MKRPIRYVALGLVIVACVSLAAAMLRNDAQAQATRPSSPVLVTNTSTERVPVQSIVQPAQNAEFGSFATGDRFSSEVELYTVPSGKTLVIEGFSVSSNLAAETERLDAILHAEFGDSILPMNWHLVPTDLGVASTGARVFRGSTQLTAYAEAGTTVVAEAARESTDLGGTAIRFGISGHLIDAP